MNITRTIRRMALAAALGATVATGTAGLARAEGGWAPATIVEASPSGRMDEASAAGTYLWEGRTRVELPEDVIAEINAWSQAYTERLAEWGAEDGPEFDAYYGGLEEGFDYAARTIMARLGYLDAHYRDGDSDRLIDPDATLADEPAKWDRDTFLAWEDASFGEID